MGQCAKHYMLMGRNVKLYSFIPSYKLPRNCPQYDAFLEPLMVELEELYIDGMEVLFSMSVEAYPPNDCVTLRVVQLLFTADMVAHAEIGLQSSSGYKGCRYCEVEAEYNDNHCHFDNFQQRYTTPAEPRSAVKVLSAIFLNFSFLLASDRPSIKLFCWNLLLFLL